MTIQQPCQDNEIKARLEQRRQDILSLIASHEENARPVELDQTRVGRLSRMDALQSQAMAKETERRRQLELARIDTALTRLEEGCLLYTSPSPRDQRGSRMPSSA